MGSKKRDLVIFFSERPATAAGVFTQNYVQAAPVLLSQQRLPSENIRAIVANSGCANASTGKRGLTDAEYLTGVASQSLGIKPESVLMASTGVIGEYLPVARIENGIKNLLKDFFPQAINPAAAVEAIMTTDTMLKTSWRQIGLESKKINIWGCAKGAGMINPNLATMLSFIFTDAFISQKNIVQLLKKAVQKSFNCLTVDGDTSTNDCVFLLANGAAHSVRIKPGTKEYQLFQVNLAEVCLELARKIAADGEGATKLIEVIVKNAPSEQKAEMLAKSVAGSPLVKTAFYGNDPNWGRVIAALGKAGVKFLPERIAIYLGKLCLAEKGQPKKFSEKTAKKIISQKTIQLTIDLHYGRKSSKIFTCDLSPEYVLINASYRS